MEFDVSVFFLAKKDKYFNIKCNRWQKYSTQILGKYLNGCSMRKKENKWNETRRNYQAFEAKQREQMKLD